MSEQYGKFSRQGVHNVIEVIGQINRVCKSDDSLSMNAQPLISVIMPCYNSEKYIEQAIESILNQTYKNIELIVVDDCSTDNSFELAKGYSKRDQRVKCFKNKDNIGATKTLNRLIEKSRGQYIARMDPDDISFEDRIEKQYRLLIKQNYDVLGTNIIFIDSSGNRKSKRRYSKNIGSVIKLENPLAHPTVLMKKNNLVIYGGYDEKFVTSQDYDLWLRLWSHGCKIGIVDEYCLYYRIHEDGISKKEAKKTLRNWIQIKESARKKYKISFGYKEYFRLGLEKFLLLFPTPVIVMLFHIYVKFAK